MPAPAPTGKSQKINWNEIARQIPGRSNKDCRKRYYNRFTGGLRKVYIHTHTHTHTLDRVHDRARLCMSHDADGEM
jgi:hypothetical protein